MSPAPIVAVHPGFEHIANIPKVFCADHETAKGLLVDLFAMIGTMNAIEIGNVNVETLPIVLQNAQKILTNLSDVMIRDCGITDADLEDVMNVFADVGREAYTQITAQSQQVEAKVTAEPPKEQKPEQRKTSPGLNIL